MPRETAVVSVMRVDGLAFHYRSGSVDEIVLRSAYQEVRFPAPHPSGGVVVDVGAHIGAFAARIARSSPSTTVHALEPSGNTFRLLRRNVRVNCLSNVVTHRLALADHHHSARLYHARENWADSLLPGMAADARTWEMVPCTTLTRFLDDVVRRPVDLLKMNIEGSECQVLLSTPPPRLRQVSRMLVELHPGTVDVRVLIGHIRDAGFALTVRWSEEETGKGWLMAQRQPNRDGS